MHVRTGLIAASLAVFALTASLHAADKPATYLVEALLRDEAGNLYLGKQVVTEGLPRDKQQPMRLVSFDGKGDLMRVYDPGREHPIKLRAETVYARGVTPPPPPVAETSKYLGAWFDPTADGYFQLDLRESDMGFSGGSLDKIGDLQWQVIDLTVFRVERIADPKDAKAAILRQSFPDYQKRTREIIDELVKIHDKGPVKNDRQWCRTVYILRDPALRPRALEAIKTWAKTPDRKNGYHLTCALAYVVKPQDVSLLTDLWNNPATASAVRDAFPEFVRRLTPKVLGPLALKMLAAPERTLGDGFYVKALRATHPEIPTLTSRDALAIELVLGWGLDPTKFDLSRTEELFRQYLEPKRIIRTASALQPLQVSDFIYATDKARRTGIAALTQWIKDNSK